MPMIALTSLKQCSLESDVTDERSTELYDVDWEVEQMR
jgi:hypothetical protein